MKCIGRDAITGEAVAVEFDQVITAVDPLIEPPPGLPYLAAGFIDLQVNGYAGVDYCSPRATAEEIARSIRAQWAGGMTRFFATVITGPPDDMPAALANLARVRESLPEAASMEAFHVEGPHISPEDGARGAHPRQWVRPPDLEEYKRWQDAARGGIRLVTLAPEWPEAPKYIEALVREGVVVAIGHTAAERRHIQDAVSAGATMSTHLGNGAHPMMRRHPNYIWEQLAEDRLAAGFICDGIHLGPAFLTAAIRAKGVERSLLVTDASTPAGAKPGRYRLGEQEVDLTEDGRVVLAGTDKLAGSALRMDRGVENLMRLAGLSLRDAITMAARNPARVGRIAGRQRGLVPGDRADLVLFRFDAASKSLRIEQTWAGGQKVWGN